MLSDAINNLTLPKLVKRRLERQTVEQVFTLRHARQVHDGVITEREALELARTELLVDQWGAAA